jgi:RNA polymerase sigma-70 factor (ECF subfamily)
MTVEALRRGRPEVLDDLLRSYGHDLHAVAYTILRDRSAAEDVVADTLLIALDKGDQLRDDSALRPWLLRIATNRALRHRHRGARIVELEVIDGMAAPAGPDAEELTTLWNAVAALAPRMRAAVVLRYYLDLSVDDVAAALEVSPNTVKTQLKSALARLRAALAEPPDAAPEVRHA